VLASLLFWSFFFEFFFSFWNCLGFTTLAKTPARKGGEEKGGGKRYERESVKASERQREFEIPKKTKKKWWW
tara:strand:- start:835 stop:1050 length:216 start_codon:yes stop_codon:yes gene_type:complete